MVEQDPNDLLQCIYTGVRKYMLWHYEWYRLNLSTRLGCNDKCEKEENKECRFYINECVSPLSIRGNS